MTTPLQYKRNDVLAWFHIEHTRDILELQRRRGVVVNLLLIFEIKLFCSLVTFCDLEHDVKTIHGLCNC